MHYSKLPDRALDVLRTHWPEYAIEAWALGTFMIVAGAFGVLLEYPGSPAHRAIEDPTIRRVLAGLAMGVTAIALIYSSWGKRSGAHMNPAVTIAFWSLGKVRGWDAVFYIAAQTIGGLLGVLVVALALGEAFTAAPVQYVATLPGPRGALIAFVAELVISGLLIAAVLASSSHARLAPYTGVFAGLLVATWISIEAPLSGMSMNPARSFASALPGGLFTGFWIYVTAPVLGMLIAAGLFSAASRRIGCAKLQHPLDVRCIHCGHEPAAAATPSTSSAPSPSLRSLES